MRTVIDLEHLHRLLNRLSANQKPIAIVVIAIFQRFRQFGFTSSSHLLHCKLYLVWLNTWFFLYVTRSPSAVASTFVKTPGSLISVLFCFSADDFTLEKIIELGLDQFAEQISEVSAAASKELSIEQVWISLYVLGMFMCRHRVVMWWKSMCPKR